MDSDAAIGEMAKPSRAVIEPFCIHWVKETARQRQLSCKLTRSVPVGKDIRPCRRSGSEDVSFGQWSKRGGRPRLGQECLRTVATAPCSAPGL